MKGLSVRSLLLEEEKQMLEVWVAGRKTSSFGIIDCFCFCVFGFQKKSEGVHWSFPWRMAGLDGSDRASSSCLCCLLWRKEVEH
jgi:hypothetical protein